MSKIYQFKLEQEYIGGKINMQTFQMQLGNRTLTIETGKMAKPVPTKSNKK